MYPTQRIEFGELVLATNKARKEECWAVVVDQEAATATLLVRFINGDLRSLERVAVRDAVIAPPLRLMKIHSETSDKEYTIRHYLTESGAHFSTCDCRGYRYGGTCKHNQR